MLLLEQSMAPYGFGQVQALSLAASPQDLYPVSFLTRPLSFFTHTHSVTTLPVPGLSGFEMPSRASTTPPLPAQETPRLPFPFFFGNMCLPLLEARRLSSNGPLISMHPKHLFTRQLQLGWGAAIVPPRLCLWRPAQRLAHNGPSRNVC